DLTMKSQWKSRQLRERKQQQPFAIRLQRSFLAIAKQQQLVIFSNQDEFLAVGSSICSGVISRVGDSLRRLLIRRGRKISALVYGVQQLQSVIRIVFRPAWEVD